MATFSFEEGLGSDTGGDTPFVPAPRTKMKQQGGVLDPTDYTNPATSDKQGTLPKDPSIQTAIMDAAKEFNVPPEYGLALADQETGYNPNAHNDEYGADGLFQFIPASAAGHGLKYGVDTRDPVKAARAAMKDFSEQMAVGGTDWAIKYHFAGPDAKGHGPKTRQYLADVNKRADDIRRLLEDPDAPVSAASAKAAAGPKTFSFEEGYGPTLGSKPPTPTQNKPVEAGWVGAATSFLGNSSEALQNAAKGTFDFVWQRLKDGPDEYLGKKQVKVERSPQEIQNLLDQQNKHWYSAVPKAGEEGFRQAHRYQVITQGDDTDLINQRKTATPEEKKEGFFPNIKNIFQLLTTDSLPANFAETLAQAPEHARQNFWKARQVAMQENIVQHPEQFPEVAVQAAQGAINARRNSQPQSVRQMWDQLKGAAKEDPGRFAAQFANALIADPEMLLAPEGLGVKVIAGTRKIATGAETISKAAKIADRVIDAGSTGAALNMGMEATSKASEGQEVTGQDMGFAAATGFGIAGPLGGIFGRGAAARERLKAGAVSKEDLEGFMRDAARDDIATEDVVNGNVSDDVKKRIEDHLGISHMSDTEKRAWHNKRQKELNKTFADESQEADYHKFKAEERILRTQQLAEDAAAKQQAEARSASVESAYVAHREEIRAQYEDDWQKALAARDQAANAQDHSEALHENTLRDATSRLDEQEIIDAAYQGAPQVRDAMLRSAQRDAKLRVPKWQRGEVDPKLIARLGIGSLFAGTAYAVAPEDSKMGASFAAGLAGLLIPGGGHVLDRMRQSGVVSSEGDIIGLLVEKGKLKPDVEVQQARLAEAENIGRAKRGDQTAYKKLYEDNFPRIKRFAQQFVREAGPKLGIDAEDVAQNTFIQAFKSLDKFNGTSGFYTWLYAIAKNEGLQAIREAKNLKGGGQYNIESMHAPMTDNPSPVNDGHSAVKGDVEAASADIDTPEALAMQEDAKQQIVAAIQKLPEVRRATFLLSRVEQYTAREIADMQDRPIGSVLSDIDRAETVVLGSLEKELNAKKVIAKPETTANVSAELPKRGRGRPKLQRGEVDPKLLLKITGVAGTAALGAYLVDNSDGKHSKTTAALGGAALGLLLFGGRGKGLRSAIDMIENAAGVASTGLLNESPKIFRRAQNAERRILENTHVNIGEVDPFLVRLSKLPKEGQQVVTRALLTGHSGVISRVLSAMGDPELTAGYAKVRAVLDSLGDTLVQLNRFKKGAGEYFPRIVKDREGLFKAIGKKDSDSLKDILSNANAESIR
jgi:RNA polymerase sigma-70 factor (ECF subfamily)